MFSDVRTETQSLNLFKSDPRWSNKFPFRKKLWPFKRKLGNFFEILLKTFRILKSNSGFSYHCTDYHITTRIRQISGKKIKDVLQFRFKTSNIEGKNHLINNWIFFAFLVVSSEVSKVWQTGARVKSHMQLCLLQSNV